MRGNFTSVRLVLDGADITNLVYSYRRTGNICRAEESVEIRAHKSLSTASPWGIVEIYENGNFINSYYIEEVSEEKDSCFIYAVTGVKRLKDYFISQRIEPRGETSRYWINYIANLTGMGVNFLNSSSGIRLYENMSLGMQDAYSAIMNICKVNAWYFWVKGNTLYIGSFDNFTDILYYDKGRILEYEIEESDKNFRNKAVVWGSYQEGEGWIFSVKRRDPGFYVIDGRDDRTVVLSNSLIPDFGTASKLADLLLSSFMKRYRKKTVRVEGFLDRMRFGSYLDFEILSGVVFSYTVDVSPERGVITEVILDDFCPRLFYYFYRYIPFSGYYISIENQGVWRKEFGGNQWYSYNQGLPPGPTVIDLKYSGENLSCVVSGVGGYVSKERYGFWRKVFDGAANTDIYSEEFMFTVPDGFTTLSGISYNPTYSGILTSGILVQFPCEISGNYPNHIVKSISYYGEEFASYPIPEEFYVPSGRTLVYPLVVVRPKRPFRVRYHIPSYSPIGDYSFFDAFARDIDYAPDQFGRITNGINYPSIMYLDYYWVGAYGEPPEICITMYNGKYKIRFKPDNIPGYEVFPTYPIDSPGVLTKAVFHNGRVLIPILYGRARDRGDGVYVFDLKLVLYQVNVVLNFVERKLEKDIVTVLAYPRYYAMCEFTGGIYGFGNGFSYAALYYTVTVGDVVLESYDQYGNPFLVPLGEQYYSGEVYFTFPGLDETNKQPWFISPYYGNMESQIYIGNGLTILRNYYDASWGYTVIGFHNSINETVAYLYVNSGDAYQYSLPPCKYGGPLIARVGNGTNQLEIFNPAGNYRKFTISGNFVLLVPDYNYGFIVVNDVGDMYVANLFGMTKLPNKFPIPATGLYKIGGYDPINNLHVFSNQTHKFKADLFSGVLVQSGALFVNPVIDRADFIFPYNDGKIYIRATQPVSQGIIGNDFIYNLERQIIEKAVPPGTEIESRKLFDTFYTLGRSLLHRRNDARSFLWSGGFGQIVSTRSGIFINENILFSGPGLVDSFSMNEELQVYPNFIVSYQGSVYEFAGTLSGTNVTYNLPSGTHIVIRTNDNV